MATKRRPTSEIKKAVQDFETLKNDCTESLHRANMEGREDDAARYFKYRDEISEKIRLLKWVLGESF